MRHARPLLLALLLAAGAASCRARAAVRTIQRDPPLPAKQTVMVPMRDGVRLATDVHLPNPAGRFPVVLVRTPYNKDAMANYGADGARRGFAVVIQDTRGRYASEGEGLPFEGDWSDAQQDGYDTAEWVAAQPWCSGKIGTDGGSALGITQLGAIAAGTKRYSAQRIVVGAPRLYQDLAYPGGIFKKSLVEDWLRATRHSPNSLKHWESHPTLDDYWRHRTLEGRYGRANAPAVHFGGWYDLFAQGTLDSFSGYQYQGGKGARGRQKLVIGPWTHGVMQERAGELTYRNGKNPPGPVADGWKWFGFTLKGEQNGFESVPAVTYYTMGDTHDPSAPGNAWRTAEKWPPFPTHSRPYYLHADRTLSRQPQGDEPPLEYTYDPKNPCPTRGGPQLSIPAGPLDQRVVEQRPDVLVFTSEPLEAPLEVTGRVTVRLWVGSDAPDTDFFAKLCDVDAAGRSYNVCEGMLRARFREGFDREVLMKPDRVYPVTLDLWSTSLIFNRGHRLRVQVTSSSAPGYDPNPNTGEPFRAGDRTRVAKNRIYLDARRRSRIDLPVSGERPVQQ